MPKYLCTNCGRICEDYTELNVSYEFNWSQKKYDTPYKVLRCPACGHDEFEIITDDQEVEYAD